ncbi:MAG: metallophosphoesterase, partial [Lachnospiraceae bacterium]
RCIYELYSLEVNRYVIHASGLRERFRLVFISDLHGRVYGRGNEKLLSLIIKEEPDAVFIGGDLIVSNRPDKDSAAYDFLAKVCEVAPVFYAPGNHEKSLSSLRMFGERTKRFRREISRQGVTYLENHVAELTEGILVAGLDMDYRFYKKINPPKLTGVDLDGYLGKPGDNSYNILLAHDPKFFKVYAEQGWDLVLSGHCHGGSIRLPLVGGVISPQFRLFPKYSKGRYELNGSIMIVSAGCGSHTINLRLFNRPEVTVVDIYDETQRI